MSSSGATSGGVTAFAPRPANTLFRFDRQQHSTAAAHIELNRTPYSLSEYGQDDRIGSL